MVRKVLLIILIFTAFIACSGDGDSDNSNNTDSNTVILVIYSDTTSGVSSLNYKWDRWNGTCDTNIYTSAPAEGGSAMQIQNNSSEAWWGFGLEILSGLKHDLTDFAQGHLVFSMKSTYSQSLNVGMQSGEAYPNNQNAVITLASGAYGFINDGSWHEVKIPISELLASNPSFDLSDVFIYLMFQSVVSVSTAPVYIDNIYLIRTNQGNVIPQTNTNNRIIPATTSTGPSNGTEHPVFSGYNLVWSDEFPGPAINSSKWSFDTNGNTGYWGTSEIQWHTDSSRNNAYISNSCLVIEARSESYNGRQYTSARLHTDGKRSWQYGVIEARILLPANDATSVTDNGIWPAFWMLGDNFNGWGHDVFGGTVGWPQCGEIDIMEIGGQTGLQRISGALHYYKDSISAYEYVDGATNGITTLFTNFHTYAVKWDSSKIEWYFDGNKFYEEIIDADRAAEYQHPHFILLNLAIDGNMGGTPTPSNYPQRMYIDWVRVYQ